MMILIQAAALAAVQPAVQEPAAPVAEHAMAAHRGHHCCCCDEDDPNCDRAEYRRHRDGQG
jgi:hypothetical protein